MARLSGFGKFFVNRSNERNSKRFFETIRSYLSLSDSSSCLELGSGKGFLSYLVYQHYRPGRIVVTDYDPLQVEGAKGMFESKLGTVPKNVEFPSADALDLPFENEMFDAIFAMVVLHRTEKKDWAIQKHSKGSRRNWESSEARGHFLLH